jgi:hypothetical protein
MDLYGGKSSILDAICLASCHHSGKKLSCNAFKFHINLMFMRKNYGKPWITFLVEALDEVVSDAFSLVRWHGTIRPNA